MAKRTDNSFVICFFDFDPIYDFNLSLFQALRLSRYVCCQLAVLFQDASLRKYHQSDKNYLFEIQRSERQKHPFRREVISPLLLVQSPDSLTSFFSHINLFNLALTIKYYSTIRPSLETSTNITRRSRTLEFDIGCPF